MKNEKQNKTNKVLGVDKLIHNIIKRIAVRV